MTHQAVIHRALHHVPVLIVSWPRYPRRRHHPQPRPRHPQSRHHLHLMMTHLLI